MRKWMVMLALAFTWPALAGDSPKDVPKDAPVVTMASVASEQGQLREGVNEALAGLTHVQFVLNAVVADPGIDPKLKAAFLAAEQKWQDQISLAAQVRELKTEVETLKKAAAEAKAKP